MRYAYLLFGFNPYHNRRCIKYTTVAEYISAASSYSRAEVNFAYRNGVETIMNFNNADHATNGNPDYVLVVDIDTLDIQSRWYVISADKRSEYTYKAAVKRDVVADYKDEIIQSPAFIEKAMLEKDDPYIFNSEGNTYNQIKSENEILLKDKTERAWIVAYTTKSTSATFKGTVHVDPDIQTAKSIENYLTNVIGTSIRTLYSLSNFKAVFKAEGEYLYNYIYNYNLYASGDAVYAGLYGRHSNTYYWRERTTRSQTVAAIKSAADATILSDLSSYIQSLGVVSNAQADTGSMISTAMSLKGKIVYSSSDNAYYRIKVTENTISSGSTSVDSTETLYSDMDTIAAAAFTTGHGSTKGYSVGWNEFTQYIISYEELADSFVEANLSIAGTERQANDLPYCAFVLPYADTKYTINGTDYYTMSKDVALATAYALASSSSFTYDVQLVPYCPILEFWDEDEEAIDITTGITPLVAGYGYTAIKDSNDSTIGIGIWATELSGTLDIDINLDAPSTALEAKIESETSIYRLTCPNYNGSFEFNLAKNNGLESVNIDYTYRPYSPYIHVNPKFGGVYGLDTNDARGLICAGDFSLPQMSEAWIEYQVNNKNYENSFKATISTQDKQHGYDMTEKTINAVTGILSGAVSGATTGAQLGGGYGAAAGAVVGAAASAIGGAADLALTEARYKTNKQLEIDQFRMNNENIQARPDSITKVSSLNQNNKIWPFIEHYHATDEEVEALEEQITYRSMTVNKIGRILSFLQEDESYIKGKIIRLTTIPETDNVIQTIVEEFDKGVYMTL